ncbi:MAG: phospholipid carrier-dependent glycosyltransferase [Candidatus Peribacter sp.]|jgi:dolichyl-phosphate-mannose--protein O-mannosyl transferase
MTIAKLKETFSRPAVLFGLLVLLLSYLTYFQNYSYPPQLFWDENYHIASAQKYLNGVYFMEPHPPLAKLLIALGEKMYHPNVATDQFITTDYARDLPDGFSFVGYRFFPALLAWLTAPVLFGIFLLLTRNPQQSTLLSFLYIFDNALIVHARGAMLESTLLFFIALTILAFLLLLETKNKPNAFFTSAALFGASFGAAMTTKDTALILILLLPFLLWRLWSEDRKDMRAIQQKIGRMLGAMGVSFAVVFCGVWYAHFAIGTHVNPSLPDNGYYQASDEYKAILDQGLTRAFSSFPVMLQDSLKFTSHYARGVPRLDLCKKDENGSPFYFWPLGARSINFRWETPEGTNYRYLYLQVNPIVWWASFAAVLLALGLLASQLFFPFKEHLKHRFMLTVFVTLYICYMIAISSLDRVMYLYHYFPPLFFGFIILGLVFLELKRFWVWEFTPQGRKMGLLLFGLLIFAAFQFYRPLTYYQPLTDEQFRRRAFFPLWELTCVKCDKVSSLVVPCKN